MTNTLTIGATRVEVDKSKPDRRTFVGGSDVAAVLGVSPWKTPLDLYDEKISAEPIPDLDKPVFKRGKRWEGAALEMLLEALADNGTIAKVIATNRVYHDEEHPWMRCEIDAELLIDGQIFNVEIKTVSVFASKDWGEGETDEVPIHYQSQAMQGLGITGRRTCIVGALFGADKLVPYFIDRDEATIKGMRERIAHFWHNHVQARIAPEPQNLADILKLFAATNGVPVEATPEIRAAVDALRDIRSQIKRLEEDEKDQVFTIADFVRKEWKLAKDEQPKDNALLIVNGTAILSWAKQRGSSLDQKKLKVEHPEIVKDYTREHWFRVMRPKKPKTK